MEEEEKTAQRHSFFFLLSPGRAREKLEAGRARPLAHPPAMGKKSAKKDRGYQTASEWAAEGGGFKRDAAGRPAGAAGPPPSHKTLPFTHCALTCEPFEDPVRVWGGGARG